MHGCGKDSSEALAKPSSDLSKIAVSPCLELPRMPRFDVFKMSVLRIDQKARWNRAEEIFEMVRDRLADSPFSAEPKASVVLSGGASQLTGLAELGTQILGRPVRVGRPLGFGRLPNEAKSASFAVPTGLLVYPQYAHLEHVEPRHTRQLRTGTDGYLGKVGRWLREGF